MEFINARDFRTPNAVWDKLSKNGEIVITNNGKPSALLLDLTNGKYEETLRAVRQAKAMRTFNLLREEAAERGYLSDAEIEAEIHAYRAEKGSE